MANTKDNAKKCQQTVKQPFMTRQQQPCQRRPPTTSRAEPSFSSISSSVSPLPSPSPSSISASSSAAMSAPKDFRTKRTHIKLSKLYTFIGETRRNISKYYVPGICNEMNNTFLMEIINKYKKGIYEVYNEALEYLDVSRMLSKNISQTLEKLKDMSTTCITLEEYYHRICELVAIFISCELRVSMDYNEEDLVANRILFTMRKYLIQDEDKNASLYNILRTLVYIPRFFSARNIMCEVFQGLIPLNSTSAEVTTMPDKLYMLYIIVFFRWMKLQKDDDGQQFIRNFAEHFMKPTLSLCMNPLYAQHLPRYTRHSEATKIILRGMTFYKDLKNACIIDNAYKMIGRIVNLCDDDDVVVVDDSAEILCFSELFAAVQLDIAKHPPSSVKRENKTIVDSVDLTVDEDDDVRETVIKDIQERLDKLYENPLFLANWQYRESVKRLQQQMEKATNVICIDTDTDEEGLTKETNAKSKKSTDASVNQRIETYDLFADSYPITVTPIDCNTGKTFNNEEEDGGGDEKQEDNDVTKLSPRFVPTTLRTYGKKSSSCSVSSAEGNSYRSYKQREVETSAAVDKNKRLPPQRTIYRRNTFHITSSASFQQSSEESSANDGTNIFYTSPQRRAKSKGPGVPYANVNSTYVGGNVIFSQSLPSREIFPNSDSQEEQQSSAKKSDQKSKRVHFNSSPMGPTSAYSKEKLANKLAADEFNHFRCTNSMTGSTTSTTASSSIASSMAKQRQEHIAAAAALFRNVLGRPRNSRLMSCSGSYPSMESPNTQLPPKHKQLFCPRFEEEKLKMSVIKRNRLIQRRSTICGRSDFNDYVTQCSSIKPKTKATHRDPRGPCHNVDWDGVPLRDRISDHLDIASDSNVSCQSVYQDKKLSKRCAVIIEPTEELLQYERERDAMYNEILQKQRRKLELRAIEKMKEKERRRQEKEQKRVQFQLEQTATMKQLERMHLCSKSDDDETPQLQVSDPTEQNEHGQEEQQNISASSVSPEKRQKNAEQSHVSGIDLQELHSLEYCSPEKQLQNQQLELETLQPIPIENYKNLEIEQQQPLQYPTPPSSQKSSLSTASVQTATTTTNGKPVKKTVFNNQLRKVDNKSKPSVDDIESSETDKIPLLQRMVRSKKSSQEITLDIMPITPLSRTRKPGTLKSSPTPLTRPIRECRQSVALQNDSSDKPKVKNRRRSLQMSSSQKHQLDMGQTTDSEFETRQPRQRRKSMSTKKPPKLKNNELTTDSEMDLEQRSGSAFSGEQRRRKLIEQSDSEVDLQGTITNMSPPRPFKGRLKFNTPDNVKPKQIEVGIKTHKVTEPIEERALPPNESSLLIRKFATRQPKQRRKSLSAKSSPNLKNNDLTTDSDLEQRPGSALRRSPRVCSEEKINNSSLKRKIVVQSDSELQSQSTIITNMSAPRLIKGRQKLASPKDDKPKQTNADIETQKVTENDSEKDAKLTEQSIVAVIAQRLSSPDSTLIDKEIETSEHEEILETLEDMLLKESRSGIQSNEICNQEKTEYLKSTGAASTSNTVTLSKSTSATEADVDMHSLIENTVINEIQREMDAGTYKISNIDPIDYMNESELAIYKPAETEVTQSAHENQHIVQTKRIIISFEDESLQDMLINTQEPQDKTTLPLLITNVQSLSNLEEYDNQPRQEKCANREEEMLITENILLSEGHRLKTHKMSIEENGSIQTAPDSLLNPIETSALQVEIPDISLPTLTFIAPSCLPDILMLDNNVNATIPAEDHEKKRSTALDLKKNKKTTAEVSKEANIALLKVINGSPEPEKFCEKQETNELRHSEATTAPNDEVEKVIDNTSPSMSLTNSPENKPNIRACYVKIEKMDVSQYMKNTNKVQDISKLSIEETKEGDRSITASPADSVISDLANEKHRTSLSPEKELLVENKNEQVSKLVETELLSNYLVPTPEAPSTSRIPEKPKSKTTKTVTFNLVAEIIPFSPYQRNISPCSIEDREQTPPNDYYWNDEDEDEETDNERIQHFYSPAARKYFNDDLLTNSNTSTYNSSTDSNYVNRRQEYINDTRERDIQKLLTDCGESSSENNYHRLSDDIAEEVVVETSNNHCPAPHTNDIISNGLLPHIRYDDLTTIGATDSVPIYLFSSEIDDIGPTDSIQVSSTFLTSNEGDFVNTVGKKSLMSPSEQEVSSTQETFFQSSNKCLTNESNATSSTLQVSTTITQSDASAQNKISSNVLQNNQVDTTNHLPEICPPSTSNNNGNSRASSTQTSNDNVKARRMSSYEDVPKRKSHSKKKCRHKQNKNKLDHSSNNDKSSSSDRKKMVKDLKKKETKDIVADTSLEGRAKASDCGRNSPPTTTFNEYSVTEKSKEKKFKIPKLSTTVGIRSESQQQNLKYTSAISGARNPFIMRSKPENTNNAAVVKNKQEVDLGKAENSFSNKDAPATKTDSKNGTQPNQKEKSITAKPEKSSTTEKAKQHKLKSRAKTKSEPSMAKEDVTSTKSIADKTVQKKSKTASTNSVNRENSTTTKSENKIQDKGIQVVGKSQSSLPQHNLKNSSTTKSDNKIQDKGKPVTTKRQISLAQDNSKKSTTTKSESKIQDEEKAVVTISLSSLSQQNPMNSTAKSENKTEDKGKAVITKSQSVLPQENTENSTKTKSENKIQDKEKEHQQKSPATKRESSSTNNVEHKAKKIKRILDFSELKKDIEVEIYTMATELAITKLNAEETNKDKLRSKDSKSKEKIKDSKVKTTPKCQIQKGGGDLLEVSNLRELTTTGIKSAIDHSGRKYNSPRNSSTLKRNSPVTVKNTHKTAASETTTKNSSSIESSNSKDNDHNSSVPVATSNVSHDCHKTNSNSVVAKTTSEANDVNSSTNSLTGIEHNSASVHSNPEAAMNSNATATTTSAATIDAGNHVRKKQRTK